MMKKWLHSFLLPRILVIMEEEQNTYLEDTKLLWIQSDNCPTDQKNSWSTPFSNCCCGQIG